MRRLNITVPGTAFSVKLRPHKEDSESVAVKARDRTSLERFSRAVGVEASSRIEGHKYHIWIFPGLELGERLGYLMRAALLGDIAAAYDEDEDEDEDEVCNIPMGFSVVGEEGEEESDDEDEDEDEDAEDVPF